MDHSKAGQPSEEGKNLADRVMGTAKELTRVRVGKTYRRKHDHRLEISEDESIWSTCYPSNGRGQVRAYISEACDI